MHERLYKFYSDTMAQHASNNRIEMWGNYTNDSACIFVHPIGDAGNIVTLWKGTPEKFFSVWNRLKVLIVDDFTQ